MTSSLDFDAMFETLPPGWLTEAEARLLWEYANGCEGPILEVGCYRGRSTCLLAALGRPVYAVDPFAGFDSDDPQGYVTKAAFLNNLAARGIAVADGSACKEVRAGTEVVLYVQPVEKWRRREVGFAYLDGDHTYRGTVYQLMTARSCGAEVVAVHDVNDDGQGEAIKRACLLFFGRVWDRREGRLAVWDLRKEGDR